MDKRRKQYVPVVVRFDTEGKLRPLVIEFDEEHKYPVDKVLDVRRVDGERHLVCRGEGIERTGQRSCIDSSAPCSFPFIYFFWHLLDSWQAGTKHIEC